MYDNISSLYHLVYPDWDKAIHQQSGALHKVATSILGRVPDKVLDVTCGIGTQALGLAALGCKVTASDLSAGAVTRAKKETEARTLELNLSVADMQDCFDVHGSGFDLVLSADNSIPHLADTQQVLKTLAGMYDCLRPGGAILLGVRNYDPNEDRSRGQVFHYGVREHEGERYVIFQTRDWQGDTYEVGMYFVRQESNTAKAAVICGRSTYYAITVDHLLSLLKKAGFSGIERLDGIVHNVLLAAKKP